MATLIRDDSIFSVKEESTEGVLESPASASDGYIQPRIEGTDMQPSRDTKDRAIYTGTLTQATPRLGMKGGAGSWSMEMKASGVEGSVAGYGILVESLFPSLKTISARKTTKAVGNTGSLLQIEDADIATYAVNDFIVVLQSGAYHPAFITAVVTTPGAATITITPSKPSGSFSASVQISKSKTYKPADTGHKSFSSVAHWGNALRQAITGCRTSSLQIASFKTGELPVLNFGYEGMTYTHTASSPAGFSPTYDSSLPPVVLGCKIFKDGTEINMNEFELGIEQPIKFLMATGSTTGKTAGRAAGKRTAKGAIKPYSDDASVANFTAWDAGTTFGLVAYVAAPDATNGIALGSIVAVYLPVCFITKPAFADEDGVVTEKIEFHATGGDVGANAEAVIGFC